MKKLLNIVEASNYIKLSQSYLRELDRKGVLEAYHDDNGRAWYTKELLDSFRFDAKYAILNNEYRDVLQYYAYIMGYKYEIVYSLENVSLEMGYNRLLSYRLATSFMEDELRLALDNKGVYLEIY